MSSQRVAGGKGTDLLPALTSLVAPVLALAAGSLAAVHGWPVLAAVVLLPLAAAALRDARVRLVVVVAGAFLVFQAPSDLAKLVYLALALGCVAVSAPRVLARRDVAARVFLPALALGAVFLLYLAVAYLQSSGRGIGGAAYFRDALPYVLLAVLPVVGLDAAASFGPRTSEVLIGFFGVVAALGVAVDWLDRRGVSTLGFGRVILSTATIVPLAFALAVVRSYFGPRRAWWGAAALVMVVSLLVTGSRTNLLILVAALGVAGSVRNFRVPIGPLLVAVSVIAGAVALLLPRIAGVLVADPEFLAGRSAGALTVLQGGAAADQSFQLRERSYSWASSAFEHNPWLGTGPGFTYPNGAFNLDTPILVPAKLGIVGTVLVAAYLVAVLVGVVRMRRAVGPAPIYTAAGAWLISLVALLPFGPWVEDKGLAVALALLLAASAMPPTGDASDVVGGVVGGGAHAHGRSRGAGRSPALPRGRP